MGLAILEHNNVKKKLQVYTDIGDYKYIELEREDAMKLIMKIKSKRGATKDLDEAIRIIKNFDEYYRYQVKRSQSYIVIPKDMRDLMTGKAVVDKLRLLRRGSKEVVEIVFDRRIGIDYILKMLGEIGYIEVSVKEKA